MNEDKKEQTAEQPEGREKNFLSNDRFYNTSNSTDHRLQYKLSFSWNQLWCAYQYFD